MYESGEKKKHVTFRLPHRKNEKNKTKQNKTTLEEEKAPPFGCHATLRDKMPERLERHVILFWPYFLLMQ